MRQNIRVLAVTSALTGAVVALFPLSGPLAAQEERSVQPAAKAHDGAASAEHITVTGANAINATGVTGRDIGGGLMRRQTAAKSVSEVGRDFIAKQSPTASAFQLLQLTPGVNAGASDPFNMQYGGGSFSVRGLDSSQIGFMFEGMPLNSTYNNSVDPSEWADTENLQSIRLAQGSPDLTSPTVNASGGVVDMTMRDPSRKFGIVADATGGTYSMARGFMRMDLGEIGHTGITGFWSISQSEADHWRGTGHDSKTHFDTGFLKRWAGGSQAKLAISFGDAHIYNYNYPTQAQFLSHTSSYNYSNVFTGLNTNYYKLHANPQDSLLVSAPTHWVLSRNLSLDFTPYTYYFFGTTGFGTVLNESAIYTGTERLQLDLNNDGKIGGSQLAYMPYIEETSRSGFSTSLRYHVPHNDFVLGQWFQYENDNLFSQYGRVGANGAPLNAWGDRDYYVTSGGSPIYAMASHSYVVSNEIYFGDILHFFDNRLRIDLGFREAMIARTGINSLPGTQYRTNLNTSEPLPTVGLSWTFNPHHQVFVSGNTAFRTPPANAIFQSAYGGRITSQGNTNLKPEYSISEEAGYRYTSDRLMASVTFFNYNFTNRLLSTAVYQNGFQYSSVINGGGQHAQGVDVEIGTGPIAHFRPYISGEFLHAKEDNNLAVGKNALPTAGKTAVRSPKFQIGFGLDYDDGHIFGNANVKWVDKQYSTLMDDQTIPSYVLANFTVGYRFNNWGFVKHPEIRLNVINAANNRYMSGAYSIQSNARAVRGLNGSMIAASGTPTYYIGTPFMALTTVTAGF